MRHDDLLGVASIAAQLARSPEWRYETPERIALEAVKRATETLGKPPAHQEPVSRFAGVSLS